MLQRLPFGELGFGSVQRFSVKTGKPWNFGFQFAREEHRDEVPMNEVNRELHDRRIARLHDNNENLIWQA